MSKNNPHNEAVALIYEIEENCKLLLALAHFQGLNFNMKDNDNDFFNLLNVIENNIKNYKEKYEK